MRRFHDNEGVEWTVALWCGSYGEVQMIFSGRGRSGEVFTSMMEAESLASAERLLLGFGEEELRVRLAAAHRWEG